MNPRALQESVLNQSRDIQIYRVNERGETVDRKIVSYEKAFNSGMAFFGFIRDGISAFDIDHEQGVQASLKAVQELESYNLSPVVIESSKGMGKAHLYVPYDSEEERILGKEIVGRYTKYDYRLDTPIRPPLSPCAKPHGLPMALVYPTGEEDAYRRLNLGKGKKPEPKAKEYTPLSLRKNSQGFPRMSLELEREFKIPKTNKSRSEHLARLAGKCKGLGWSGEEFAEACLYYPSGAGSKALSNHRRDPKGWLINHVWNGINASRGDTRTEEDKEYIEKLKEWSFYIPPKQRAGVKSLIEAILGEVETSGKYENFHLSYRNASALMGTSSLQTAINRITWAIEAGFLEVTKKGTLTMATEYRVCLPKESLNSNTPYTFSQGESQGDVYECYRLVPSQETELLRRYREAFHGLNMGYTVAWELLRQGEATVKALSERLNRRVSQIQKYLRALEFYQIVKEEDGVWSLTLTQETIENMAHTREKIGLFARYRAGYERHKEARREHQRKTYTKFSYPLAMLESRVGVRSRPRESEPVYAYLC
jgi:hypothetical protein